MDSAAFIRGILEAPLNSLEELAAALIADKASLPTEYLESLNEKDKADALRACLIVFLLTLSTSAIVPRVFQLQASLAILHGLDTIITAGTGTGKTLCLLIPILLRPNTISITISPLKRLQKTQVSESEKYGINTIAINEDTPSDPALWESIRKGHYQHLIVSPEQLTLCNGHLSRLARLVRQDRTFRSKIGRVHVDEAHNIYTAGRAHHGEAAAFRPAYSRLGEFRNLLSNGTPFQILSATLPPHILSAIKHELLISPNHVAIQLSSNRPNITYATIPLVNGLRDFHNLNFLVPNDFRPPMNIPKTLVFHDRKQDAVDATNHVNSRLPEELQNRGIVKHYHSDMSPEYLEQTYKDFSDPNGCCRILHATAGASTGLDIRGVQVVIQYGICQNMAELIQRAGRAARDPSQLGLFVVMFEPWALEVKLDNVGVALEDPDRPIGASGRMLKKTLSKQERTGRAMIAYVQSKTCLRRFFSSYVDDQTHCANEFTGNWCCDRHDNTDFNLSAFLPGQPYTGQPSDEPVASTKRKRTQYRVLEDRERLFDVLYAWRHDLYLADPCRSVRSITWICDDGKLQLLSKIHPTNINTPNDICNLLEETTEWESKYAKKVFDVIRRFDEARVRKAINVALNALACPAAKKVCYAVG